MSDSASTRGLCPSCEREGRVGHACARSACERHGTHYIPARFVTQGRHRDPRIGLVIARHLLVERLARPDIDLLYRAIQVPALLEVELALVPTDRQTDVHDNLLRQALALGRLGGHPNITRLILFGVEPEGTFLVFDSPPEASTLSDVVTPDGNDLVPSAGARILLEPLAAALEALARAHLVHGEIRPDNVLVQAHAGHLAFVQLAGFVRIPPVDSAPPLAAHTQVWRPPEQIFEHAVNATTDCYSLAAITFALLFGRPPFPAHDRDALYEAKRDDSYDPCEGLAAAVPPAVLHFFGAALATDPDARFNSDGFRNALFAALDALAADEAEPAVAPSAASRHSHEAGTDVWQPSTDTEPIRQQEDEPPPVRPTLSHRGSRVHDVPLDDAPHAGRPPRFHHSDEVEHVPVDDEPHAARPPRFHRSEPDEHAPVAADDDLRDLMRGDHTTQQLSTDELEGLASRRGTPRMHKKQP